MKIGDAVLVRKDVLDMLGRILVLAGARGVVVAVYVDDDTTYVVDFDGRKLDFWQYEIGELIEVVP